MAANRTEKPTPKRRRDAEKKGQVARSKEISSALSYLSILFFLGLAGVEFLNSLSELFGYFWRGFLTREITRLAAQQLIFDAGWGVMKLAGPPLLLTLCLGLGGALAQGGLVLSSHPLKFQSEKLNPAKNLKRVFSSKGLVELIKAVALIGVVGYLAGSALWGRIEEFQQMIVMDIPSILVRFGEILFQIGSRIGLFLGFLAVGDYLFQRYRFEEGLKQTKEEVKEDQKETEGNPLLKSRIRRLQREMARKRMMTAVETADVIVTNPTEYAVALKYELGSMAAPRVVAKGKGFLARKIKEVAANHKVPAVENVPLAQALYKSVEIGQEVPAKLYKAVAQILAYIYRLKGVQF